MVATPLGEPDPLLASLLAARGWSHRDFSREYAEQCVREGRSPQRPSVTTISRWINGAQTPTPENRYIMRRLFGVSTDQQLGFQPRGGWQRGATASASDGQRPEDSAFEWTREPISERLGRALRRPSTIDPSQIEDIEQRTRLLDRTDRREGARKTFDDVLAHLAQVTALLETTAGDHTYMRLAVLAGDIAQLAAWLCFDRRDFTRAETYSTLAVEAGRTAGRRELAAYAQGQQAYIAIHRGRTRDAIDFVEAAIDKTSTGLTGAWLARVEAETRARLHDRAGCRRALERARDLLNRGEVSGEGVPWVAYFANVAHLDRAEGRCMVQLGEAEAARESLRRALALRGPFVRARGGALAEAALTYMIDRDPDPDQAANTALEALEIAQRTGSLRNLERVREVDARLTRWRSRPAVRELRAALRLAR